MLLQQGCVCVLCCFFLYRDEPRKLLAVLTAADHPLAQHPDSSAALQELALLFDYLEVGESYQAALAVSTSAVVGALTSRE
jgi:hypothetical protein